MLKNWIIGMGMMVLLGCEAGSEDSERLVADSVELERDVSENPASGETLDADLELVLVECQPRMEFTDKYRWELAAPPGATVVARATMPSHGHGTIPATVEGVKDEGSGLIVLEPLYLFMGGEWEVELTITLEDGSVSVLRIPVSIIG